MKGAAPVVWVLAIMLVAVLAVAGTWAAVTYLAVPPRVAPVYDGEFSTDAQIATEGPWGSAFNETSDCNVTSDILGDSAYQGCRYSTTSTITNQNNTEFDFPFQFEIDTGTVQGGSIDMELQNTGTGQFKDDMSIKSVEIWTHEDQPRVVYDLSNYIENAGQSLDAVFGSLPVGEYVLYTVFKTKTVYPAGVTGDDICKMKIKLTTSGDAKTAYILAENGPSAV